NGLLQQYPNEPNALQKHLDTLKPHEKLTTELSIAALERDRQKNWQLRSNPGRLQLKTIDAFCSGIVFQLPVLSELGGQCNIIENPENIFQEASYRFLRLLEKENRWSRHIENVLTYFDKRPEEMQGLLTQL